MSSRRAEGPGALGACRAFGGPVRHVYVHVPFCRARCDYCDFASQAVGDEPDDALFEQYLDGVAAEWEREKAAAHDVRRLRTLYIGGGTPSLLGPDRLERLLELFRPSLTPGAEVTVEANPEDVDEAFAAWAAAASGGRAAAVSRASSRGLRISLGVQSFAPALRRALGRSTEADPAAALERLRAAGVGGLSVDLIHGIPGQTEEELAGDIRQVLALRPDHVSWYELSLSPGTPLAARAESPPAGRDGGSDGAVFYRRIVRDLGRAGYDWYEVSNFALPGNKARHNLAYWRARPYLGLGPGAVSTVGGRRWTDLADAAAWATALAAGEAPPRATEQLDAATRERERLLLAARCGDPVLTAEVADALDLEAAATLAHAGLVSLHSGTIRVTRKGRYVAGAVCVRLFRD